jgi:membrane complex biogenesis BtpA family protein
MSIANITSQAKQKPIIGMVHLAPLPGSPRSQMSLNEIASLAMHDAKALVEGGVHALMIENFGDVPFSPARVDTQTVAAMTRIIYEIRAAFPKTPLGVNVLRNDGVSALSIAAAVDAQYVRINVLSGARLTDQGTIESCAYDVLRTRKNLNVDSIEIMADVDVKHSYPLAPVSIEQEVADLFDRSLASAVIVSGSGTGGAVDIEKLKRVKTYAGDRMVCLGSGVNQASLGQLLSIADCAIVGTAFKFDGDVRKKVDRKRVDALMGEHRKMFK